MKKADIIVSLLIGALLGCIPAGGVMKSWYTQPSGFMQRPERERYEVELFTPIEAKAESIDVHFEEMIGTDSEEGDTEGVKKDIRPDNIPEDIKAAAEKYGAQFGICPEIIEAIAEHESSFVTTAVNDTELEHSVGILQINLKCTDHQKRLKKYGLTEKDLQSIDNSVLVACDYLAELFDAYEDPGEVLIRYNGDKTGFQNYRDEGELSEYANEILERAGELEELHGK